MDPLPHLLGLPNELILYILRHFLDLGDVWRLLQVSRQFRQFAIDTINKRWRIELVFTPETIMKIQCRAALIALERISCQLYLQTRRHLPTAIDGSFNSSRLSPPFLPMVNGGEGAANSTLLFFDQATNNYNNSMHGDDGEIDEQVDPAQQQQQGQLPAPPELPPRPSVTTPPSAMTLLTQTSGDNMDIDLLEEEGDDDDDDDEDEEDDDETMMDNVYNPTMTMRSLIRNMNDTSASSGTTPTPTPTVASSASSSSGGSSPGMTTTTTTTTTSSQITSGFHGSDFLLTTPSCDSKLFHDLMRKEDQLHQRIIRGISSYKHKYVLIEDIDIRNRIRSTVDVIFHHAVFVSALHTVQHKRSLAAMMVRLLTRLDAAFPSYCREITYTLADHIKAFLEYTGYKLLAQKQDHLWTNKPTHPLLLTLHNIAACFDLMGAAFVGKILGESHVECAVQRTCELLTDDRLALVKKSLLVDLLENWLTIKRGLVAGELCRLVRSEIEACGGRTPLLWDRQQNTPFYYHRHHLHYQVEQDQETSVRPSSIHTRYQLS